jgi:c-di-GMP-binding flagellar brake protein YcgR
MVEKRKLSRKIANDRLVIKDQISGSKVGTVVNISAAGFMLLSEKAIKTGNIYQFDLLMPQLVEQHSQISFGAEALWCSEAAQAGSYWTGFQIIDISSRDEAIISKLIEGWSIQE